jgi:hypothetical protein
MYVLHSCHDSLGHKGIYSTSKMIRGRFWWPGLEEDVKWFIKTCDTCQKRRLELFKVPPVHTHTPSIFQVLHCDTMEMTPQSNGCKYILHGRCGLSSWPEGRGVKHQKAKQIARWLYEDIITRWCCIHTIVTDNAPQFKSAVAWLRRLFGIEGITISPYNSKANAVIESPHYNLREALARACEGNLSKWYWHLPQVLWADRISIRKRTGVSPFFLVTGTHPIIPLDILEATWLVEAPNVLMSTEELIGWHTRALMKHREDVLRMRERVSEEKAKRLLDFEQKFGPRIKDWNFKRGDLVLIRDSARKMSLDRKAYDKWFGPCIVVRQAAGGAYICAEMNGAVIGERISRDRVMPYFARTCIELPKRLEDWIDISRDSLRRLVADLLTRLLKDPDDLMGNVGLPGQAKKRRRKARMDGVA